MKSAFLLLMGSALLSSCAITQSSSCRKAAQGDIPCQGLNGLDFQKCQLEVRRAVATCQAEQMHKSPDSVGVYRLPPPDPVPATAVTAPPPVPVAPVVAVPEQKDTAKVAPVPAERTLVATTPSAPIAAPVDSVVQHDEIARPDSVVKEEPAPVHIDSSTSGAKDSTPVVTPKAADTLAKPVTPAAPKTDSAATAADSTPKSDSTTSSLVPAAPLAAATATIPSDAISSDSASVTEPVKKKRKKKKTAEPVAQ